MSACVSHWFPWKTWMESPAKWTAASEREAKSDSRTHCRRAARIKLLVNAMFLCPADHLFPVCFPRHAANANWLSQFSWKMADSSPRRRTTDDYYSLETRLMVWFFMRGTLGMFFRLSWPTLLDLQKGAKKHGKNNGSQSSESSFLHCSIVGSQRICQEVNTHYGMAQDPSCFSMIRLSILWTRR